MFWRVSGVNTASPVDSILDKEEFTLEELLNEDELIQECKALNARLTTFLKQKEVVEKLIAYLVEDPPQETDDKRQFKYPFAACEIFCCEVESVYNTLLESDELMDKLFGLVHGRRPLNSILAGYFARVIGSLLFRCGSDVMQYLQRHQDLLPALVYHVDTTSVAEVLARVIGADDPRGYPNVASLQWLTNTPLLNLLVDALGPDSPAEGQANAAEVLAAIARSVASPLTSTMATPDFMERLVDAALAPHEDRAATHALNVCIALLEPAPPTNPNPGAPYIPMELHEQLRVQAIRCIAAATNRLVALLEDGSGGGELKTSYGLMGRTVGQLRLKAVDLIAALLRTGEREAETEVMKTKAVQRAMELFIAYPFNNALHGGVAALLTAFESGSDDLRGFLLKDAGLVDWLIAAPEEVRPDPNPDATALANGTEGERPNLRAGYCGHLTQVANRLLQLEESSELVREFLSGHPQWQKYVIDRLEPRNKLESVFAWRCGRPSSLGQDVGAGGVGLYRGDMAFSSLDTGTFSGEVYQRYAVYDEDEDEDEAAGTPEWRMDLTTSAGASGDSGAAGESPPTSPQQVFTGFNVSGIIDRNRGDSGTSEEGHEDVAIARGEIVDEETDLVVVSSPPGGGCELVMDSMDDMQDDAVVVEDEGDVLDAAETLVELQREMSALEVSVGGRKNTAKGENASSSADNNGNAIEASGRSEVATEKTSEESAGGAEFNANVFWKPTFEVAIDDADT